VQLWGEDAALIGSIEDPSADADKVCDVMMDYFRRVMDRPPAQAAEILRTMYGS